MNGKLSVIVPAYNKGPVLYKTLFNLISSIDEVTDDFELIIVNDGSKDNTLLEAKKIKKLQSKASKIKIYNYKSNNGKGYALQYGFFRSSGDYVVFFDADLDIDSHQIVNFLSLLENTKADIIIGSKYHPESRISYPKIRFIYSLILKFIIRILFQLHVSDTQVGLKAFKRGVLEKTMPVIVVKRFAFDLELLVVAAKFGFTKIIEVPVVLGVDKFTSTIKPTDVRNFFQDILAIFYRKNILRYYDQIIPIQNSLNPAET